MTRPQPAHGYSFGDTDAAAERLALLDRVFDAPSGALLTEAAARGVGLAVDLGCGPGHSTRRLAELTQPVQLAGVDVSESFLARARASGLAARWYQHDLTVTPLPTGPADLLYARLVLAHLPGPDHVLSGWLEGLGPGGRLLVEETEEVVAGHPLLASYEEMAGSLVAHRGGELLLGRRLAAFEPAAGFAVVLNRVVRHPVPLAVAARLFAMNFRTWRHDPFITAGHPPSALQEMGVGLDALADGAAAGEVVFRIRQVAVERR